MSRPPPSMDAWLKEAKADSSADKIGMYLFHNGVVRATPKAQVRLGEVTGKTVSGMDFSFDQDKAAEAVAQTSQMAGIYYIRVWLNAGRLRPGDDLMYVLVGGDIRPHVVAALESLVETLKTQCVIEKEIFDST